MNLWRCRPIHGIEPGYEGVFVDPNHGQQRRVSGFCSAAPYSAMVEAVEKFVPNPSIVDAVATKLIDAYSFTVSVDKFVKYKVKKTSLNKAKIKKLFA